MNDVSGNRESLEFSGLSRFGISISIKYLCKYIYNEIAKV